MRPAMPHRFVSNARVAAVGRRAWKRMGSPECDRGPSKPRGCSSLATEGVLLAPTGPLSDVDLGLFPECAHV